MQGFSLHYKSGKPGAMEEALRQLCADVEAAVEKGTEIVVLSDRGSMDAERPPIPTLLAVGAVHHHLIKWVPNHCSTSMKAFLIVLLGSLPLCSGSCKPLCFIARQRPDFRGISEGVLRWTWCPCEQLGG